jgi:hypothetical protein
LNADNLPSGFLLEHHSGYRLGREELLVQAVAKEHGRSVEIASLSQIRRGKVKVNESVAVIGSIPFVKAALTQLGGDLPVPNPYPTVLREYLHRPVTVLHIKEAFALIDHSRKPVFIKPAERWKSFTGCVPADSRDIRLNGASRNQNVWVSDPVRFLSEWRVYVLNGELRHLSWYDGNRDIMPNRKLIQTAIAQYVAVGAPVGFAIDFGVLESGETALVEANDGFSVGAYEDVDPLMYTLLIAKRWEEMARAAIYPTN